MFMPDPYLEAMMRGEFSDKKRVKKEVVKDKFEIALENQIDEYVDSLELDSNQENNLLSPAAQKARLKQELKEGAKLTELDSFLSSSARVLVTEGKKYLEAKDFEDLENALRKIPEIADGMDLNKERTESFQKIFNISDKMMESILKVAREKFEEEKYEDTLSIFALLSTLAPENADYWLQLGVAAQRFQNFDLALRAYAVLTEPSPELMQAKLLSTQCFLEKGDLEGAKASLGEAKKIAETVEIDAFWRDLLKEISALFQNA